MDKKQQLEIFIRRIEREGLEQGREETTKDFAKRILTLKLGAKTLRIEKFNSITLTPEIKTQLKKNIIKDSISEQLEFETPKVVVDVDINDF